MLAERELTKTASGARPPYYVPEKGYEVISTYVDEIVSNPGQLISPKDLDALFESNLNTRETVANLPDGITEEDFGGELKLACYTECATDSYARQIKQSAVNYGQDWLVKFNDIWVKDERSHFAPFKKMLMELGYSEAELDGGMKDAREADFNDGDDYAPDSITTNGTVQEYLTENYYGLLYKMTKDSSPEAAQAIAKIKKRETLHRVWYARMSALQVEANPDNLVGVAIAAANFRMPGNIVAPEYQARAGEWIPKMGADVGRMQKDVAGYITDIAGNPERAGKLLVEIADQKGIKIGPITPQHIKFALNRFGDAGYGIFGEAAIEKYALKDPIPANSVTEKIRSMIRGKVVDLLPDIEMLAV